MSEDIIASTDPDPLLDQIEAAASDTEAMITKLEHETMLSEFEAAIVVYDHLGLSADEIGDKLARGAYSIEEEIRELRKEREEIADRIEKIQQTAAALQGL